MDFQNALNFSGKQVLVTGASDGIGFGIAKAFLSLGATVSVTGTREENEYKNDFSGMTFYRVSSEDLKSIDALREHFSSLDVLVNCIGTVLYQKQEFEIESFKKVIDINLTGLMYLCTSFYPLLKASNGNIINLDSVVAIQSAVNNPAYSASKAGLKQLTAALAKKWGRDGVRVNGIGPGLVPTKITASQTKPEYEEGFGRHNPIARFGTPDDMAGAAVFLASDLAAYVTGQSLAVDGGLTL